MDTLLPGLSAAPNLHPLLVHFPLALWPVALLFLAVAYLRAKDDMFVFASWLLYASVLGGVVAAVTGWFAAESLGHEGPGHNLVHDHRSFMLAALAFAAAAAGAAYWTRLPTRRQKRWLPVGLVLLACLFSTVGADRGGLLVYGYGLGVSQEPPLALGELGQVDLSQDLNAHSH